MPTIDTKDKYLDNFSDIKGPDGKSLREKALYQALDTRKFEIDLYWKRATYFWAFIAVTFVAYFSILSLDNLPYDLLFLLNCLGFIFSLSWYFVNRGSKFWQENWEKHVDMLEDDVIGPLYKITLNAANYKFCPLHKEYGFSVTKINQILSMYIAAIWIYLAIRSTCTLYNWYEPWRGFNSHVLILMTAFFIHYMVKSGTTDQHGNPFNFIYRENELGDNSKENAPNSTNVRNI